MTELKPCPFCGGEAEIHAHTIEPGWETASALCTECYAQIVAGGDTKEEALENIEKAWNSRYERTCTNVSKFNKPKAGEFNVGGHFECSNCGFMYGYAELPYSYCPGCGAIVGANTTRIRKG